MVRVAIVAYQGGVAEHAYMLRRASEDTGIGVEIVYAKRPESLQGVDAVILPGGESTTIGRLMARMGLLEPLRRLLAEEGVAALGTCAGAALLAKQVRDRVRGVTGQPLLAVMDTEVTRNYYGRQRESFEALVKLRDPTGLAPELEERPFHGVFIRAPAFTKLWGKAEAMGLLGGDTVAAVQERIVALSFHPELTKDTRIHRLLLRLAKK
jgi:5'-phosphate synthase pdxT subunit